VRWQEFAQFPQQCHIALENFDRVVLLTKGIDQVLQRGVTLGLVRLRPQLPYRAMCGLRKLVCRKIIVRREARSVVLCIKEATNM
jgi:hypothetical protein